MELKFPPAVPEIPVTSISKATAYYEQHFGFNIDWSDDEGGIAGISRGQSRIFLTNGAFREGYGNAGPVMIWLNVDSREEVNTLHAEWSRRQAKIVSPPESKPWKLHEFIAADLDGNQFRVFYDFAWEEKQSKA
jgi:predicted lactoylglutathione lyase